MNALNEWYDGMTKGQRYFVWAVSAAGVLVYGIGLIPLVLLIYLQLGAQARK